MKAATAQPVIPGLGAERSTRRFMLAALDGQRRLRVVKGGADVERWARAWARRWFVVDGHTADEARRAIKRYLDAAAIHPTGGVDAADFGILASGRNAAGGPRQYPVDAPRKRSLLPRPAARPRRRARARGPTPRGNRLD